MYKVYIKTPSSFDGRKLIGEFTDIDDAREKIDAELAKDENIKYLIEEMTGAVNVYGEPEIRVVDKN